MSLSNIVSILTLIGVIFFLLYITVTGVTS